MKNLFDTDGSIHTPSMTLEEVKDTESPYEGYRYKIRRFELSGGDDGTNTELEDLFNRSLSSTRDVIIVNTKDSISTATGVYTIIVSYMERRLANDPGEM